MATNPKIIQVEGWRGLPQSYAIVNSFQLLEMLKRSDCRVRHVDIPYGDRVYPPIAGLFDARSEALLAEIPSPIEGEVPDAVYRIACPFNYSPSGAQRTFVFTTIESGHPPLDYVASKKPITEAIQESNCVLITPSNWSRNLLIEIGVPAERIVWIPLGIDLDTFRPLSAEDRRQTRESLGWTGCFVFISLGSMTWNKGIPMLVKAFAVIAAKHPSACLVLKGLPDLYGAGEYHEAFKSLSAAEASLVEGRIRYSPATMSFSALAQLYQAADTYVSPYHAEGFNMPVLEAAACGLPIICTRGGSTDDFTRADFTLPIQSKLFRDRKHLGLLKKLLEPDFEDLVNHMLRVIDDEDFKMNAALSGPAFVAQHYSWKHIVDQLLDVMFGDWK